MSAALVAALPGLCVSGGALAQAGKVTIKLNVGTPAGHPYNVGAETFKRIVEADAGGAVAVQIFPSAQLGSEVESAKNVQLGTLEATIASTSNMSSFVERFNILGTVRLQVDRLLVRGRRRAGVRVHRRAARTRAGCWAIRPSAPATRSTPSGAR
jgi:hypothetical protein